MAQNEPELSTHPNLERFSQMGFSQRGMRQDLNEEHDFHARNIWTIKATKLALTEFEFEDS
eukprot:snap_masked-scaffold_23-processed-gene-3.30-mRNA-1 protein AED:1.00 eAED:1.00 QI:0/-1/0/0/-1/1/1/0/60